MAGVNELISPRSEERNQVELLLWEPSAVNRSMYPVTVGVPVTKGLLTDKDQICLLDDDREIPCTASISAKWDDDSIKWLLLDFQVDLVGNQKKKLLVKFNAKPLNDFKPESLIVVKEIEQGLIVDSGCLRVEFINGARIPFNEVYYKGRSILNKNRIYCTMQEGNKVFYASGESVKVKLESLNEFRAVVRCDGKFTAEDGSTCLDVTTRVYLFAGKSYLKIYHTITNLEGRDVNIQKMSFNISTTIDNTVNSYITGNGVNDSVYKSIQNEASLAIGTVPVPETKYDRNVLYGHVGAKERLDEIDGTMEHIADSKSLIRFGDGSEQKLDGHRELMPYAVSGMICDDGTRVALSCRNFYLQAPKMISVIGNEIILDLYNDLDNKPLQFWRGTAKTHEVHLIFQEGGALEEQNDILEYKKFILALEEPVAPTFGESSWLQKSGVLGPLLYYKPDKYPWLEFMFRRGFELWKDNKASVVRGSTILDFGDSWNPSRGGQWQNNEMDFGGALLLNMLRTGYPAPFSYAENAVHHMMDVDTHHEAPNKLWTGAQRYHQVRHGAFSGPTLCHEWLEGPLIYYLYTGYERAREIAVMRANHFCMAVESGVHRIKQLERVQGWPLVALSIMNEYFPDSRYIKACNSIPDLSA
jgi:hypothetical protein